jgi:hypothetical protein
MAKAKKAPTARRALVNLNGLTETLRRVNDRIARLQQAREARARLYPFQLGDRVAVPGLEDVQGVVNVPRFAGTALPKSGIAEQQFYVTWVNDAGVGADGWFTVSELRAVNLTLGALVNAMRERSAAQAKA